jgi:hypothetical protein
MAPNIFNDADHTVDTERERQVSENASRESKPGRKGEGRSQSAPAAEFDEPPAEPTGKIDGVLKQIYGF